MPMSDLISGSPRAQSAENLSVPGELLRKTPVEGAKTNTSRMRQTVHSSVLPALCPKTRLYTLDYVPGVLGPQEGNSGLPVNEDSTS